MRTRLLTYLRQTNKYHWIPLAVAGGSFASYFISQKSQILHAAVDTKLVGERKSSLPTFTMDEVGRHKTKDTGYWLAYKDGVYDITSFVENHPGGKQILKTAGKALEACWKIFTIHQIDHVYEILEEYRIGNLPVGQRQINEKAQEKIVDLFQFDPERPNAEENFFIRSEKPFNAETKPSKLISSFLTPNEQFYIRNHLHVPVVNLNEFQLELTNGSKSFRLSYDDLKEKFPSHSIVSVVQCAGNRRFAMNNPEQGVVQGTSWYVGALGNAKWTGVRLRDVLKEYQLDQEGKHVQFFGLDCDSSQRCYGASIPIEKALTEDVLIAFEMNDETLSSDHGFPLRILVPGTVGARSVKWVNRIVVSQEESESHWQRADYKILPSSIKQPQQIDYDQLPALQDGNVQSAICSPSSETDGNKVQILSVRPTDDELKKGALTVKGYAFSGGGRRIQNVQLSIDQGKTWFQAKLEQLTQPYMRSWAWTLWSYDIPLDRIPPGPFEIVCRAMDEHSNAQPDTSKGIWNIRGLMNNSWHRLTLNVEGRK